MQVREAAIEDAPHPEQRSIERQEDDASDIGDHDGPDEPIADRLGADDESLEDHRDSDAGGDEAGEIQRSIREEPAPRDAGNQQDQEPSDPKSRGGETIADRPRYRMSAPRAVNSRRRTERWQRCSSSQ